MIAVGIMQFVVVSPILSFAPDEGNQIADKRHAFFIGPTGEIAGLPLLLGVKKRGIRIFFAASQGVSQSAATEGHGQGMRP
jgi:hypothetical protein